MAEKLGEKVECPKCHRKDKPILLDRVLGQFHIPDRYVLKCVHCDDVFYKKVDDGPDETRSGN